MRLAILKQPRFYLPASLALILGVVSAVVFHPAFQRKMLLDHVGPLVDSLEIGYIHFTPWSLELNNVSLGYQGGQFSVGEGTLRYCLSSLLLMNLNIKTLALKDVSIDLEHFTPPETAEEEGNRGPFPGVLASLEHGIGYTLQEVMIDAAVRLPGARGLTARISGGGIKPEASGAITVALRFDTGNKQDHIQVDGSLDLDQLTRGRFAAVETALAIQASLEKLPEMERVDLNLAITPSPAAAGQQESTPAAENDGKPRYNPEALHVALRLPDGQGGIRSALDLEGVYDGNTGGIEGGYRVTANERLVQPYIKDAIPPSAEVLTGQYRFDTATLTGDMTVISDLLVKEIREVKADNSLPDMLQLRNNFRVSLLPGMQLRVETLDTAVSDNADNKPLETRLPGDLHIPMDDFAAFLRQENTLLEFELPGVPLVWFNIFLPDYQITDGALTAAFEVTTDGSGAIHVRPVKPLKVNGLTVKQQDNTLIEGLNMTVLPGVNYSGDALGVSLKKLVIDAGNGALVTANLDAGIPLAGGGDITAQAGADLDLYRLLDVLAIKPKGRTTLPRQLALETHAALRQKPGLLTVNTLDAGLSLENKTSLVKLHLLHPLLMENTPAGPKLGNAAGKLATLTLGDIDLNWFSAFVPDATLKGRLSRADLTLTADEGGAATITSDKPVALRHVTVATREGLLLDDLGISLRPVVRISPAGTRIDYKRLGVTSRRARLVSGDGRITLPASADNPLVTDGHLSVDVQALARQPLIARALQAGIDAPVRLEADYSLARDAAAIDIDRLSAGLFYTDPEPRVSLQADSRLRVRTRIGGRQSELARTTGKVTLTLAQLTPEPFANILKANGLAFASAAGKAVLTSNGRSLTIDTIEPFRVAGLSVKNPDGAVLNPFTLVVDSETTLQGSTLQAKLDELSVTFDRDKGKQALNARADLTLKGAGDDVSLETLNADLSASLPSVLDQPAILPGHTLTAGKLTASAHKDPDGKFSATTRIGDLKARKTLALQTLILGVDGRLADDGGFTLTAPLRGQGKSGDSDIQVKAGYAPAGGSNKIVDVAIDSTVFYLNDILNTLNSIAGKQRATPSEERKLAANDGSPVAEQQLQALNLKPDERAFWDTSDYDARVKFSLDRLFYTDYLEFRDIQGNAALLPDKLELGDFSMHFHDSPITLDGRMSFAPGETPYDLKLRAGVEQLDLAKFFRELVPGSTPRAEGLFDVSLNAFGSSPNLPEYRNRLFFDMRLQSRDGVFRPFNPDSALLAGSSGFAGVFGEGVSNIPTGLFGLGAVSRLVNYMKEIDYDKIDIHLVRDESRDVQIREYVVQSPDILMTATGGIKYEEGVDIIDSPLSMEARLDMRERGAAILYSLDLLQSEKDDFGYWKGPVFKVWGTIARRESNLEDIISEAGRGAVLGGITRPLSGLWGNLKYWWFGGGEEPAANDTQ